MNELSIRDARETDLTFIVGLIDSDDIAARRDSSTEADSAQQREAFDAIVQDRNHRLLLAELDGKSVGSFQLSFIPGVSRRGAWRGQIESVRVHPDYQGTGIGKALMEWAIKQCRERGCRLVQLTSDVQRVDAHRFYERLGFKPTHTGFKLVLE